MHRGNRCGEPCETTIVKVTIVMIVMVALEVLVVMKAWRTGAVRPFDVAEWEGGKQAS